MAWLSTNDRLSAGVDLFADQFEPHGQGFLYRKRFRGVPIPVSAAEKDAFVKAFDRAQKATVYVGVPLMVICIAVLSVMYPSDRDAPEWTTAALVGIVVTTIVAMTKWSWNAPVRALRGRETVGRARTAAEARALALSQMSYRQLAAGAGIAVFLLLYIDPKHGLLSVRNSLLLAVVALLIVGVTFQTYRKWCFERTKAES